MTYSILVWAEDTGKFAKEILKLSEKERKLISKLLVLGTELKIEDLKLLEQIKELIPFCIEQDVFDSKRDAEIFALGRFCTDVSENTRIIFFATPDKSLTENRKKLWIKSCTWEEFLKESTEDITKSRTRRSRTQCVQSLPDKSVESVNPVSFVKEEIDKAPQKTERMKKTATEKNVKKTTHLTIGKFQPE